MGAAVFALALLVWLGVTPASLGAVVVASMLSTISVMLYGSRRRKSGR
jgi:hypothetical protein